jgi:hypothetical protein
MELAAALIAGWFPSSVDKFTYVVASGGASFPAKESVEEVSRLYKLALLPEAKQPVAMTPETPTTGITKE